MNSRDKLLRAAVYAAYDARGTDRSSAACGRVVFVHRTWPLIEYEHAIERAGAEIERRDAELAAWMVETAEKVCGV